MNPVRGVGPHEPQRLRGLTRVYSSSFGWKVFSAHRHSSKYVSWLVLTPSSRLRPSHGGVANTKSTEHQSEIMCLLKTAYDETIVTFKSRDAARIESVSALFIGQKLGQRLPLATGRVLSSLHRGICLSAAVTLKVRPQWGQGTRSGLWEGGGGGRSFRATPCDSMYVIFLA